MIIKTHDSTNALFASLDSLIVDDDPVSLALLNKLSVRTVGAVTTAVNGVEALEAYKKHAEQTKRYFDVVITDIDMPEMDGYQLIEKLREINPNQYIIVVSSHDEKESFLKLIELDVNGFLIKPLSIEKFHTAIQKAFFQIDQQKSIEAQNVLHRETAFRFNTAVEGKGEGLWDWNIEHNTVYFSNTWKKMLGFEPHEIEDSLDEWEKRVHPDQLSQVYADIQNHMDGITPTYENEHQILCKDGRYKWILDRGIIVARDEKGNPTRFIGTHTDINEQKLLALQLQEQKEEFETLFNQNIDGIAILDFDTNFIKTNAAYQNLVGFNEDELANLNCLAFTAPEDIERVEQMLEELLDKKHIENFEKRCIVKDDREIYVNVSVSLMNDQKHIILSARDVTELRYKQYRIDKYLNLIDQNIISLSLDIQGEIISASSRFFQLTQLDTNDIIGKNINDIVNNTPINVELFGKFQNWLGEICLETRLQEELWLSAEASIYDNGQEHYSYTLICQDISDKKKLEIASITDPLTGLFNRRFLEFKFPKIVNSAKRAEEHLSFLMIDIDFFKLYNDNYGHKEGDEVLTMVAECIKEVFQRADDYAFRVGGEEFVVIYKTHYPIDAKNIAEKLVQCVYDMNQPHDYSTHKVITISAGLITQLQINQSSTDMTQLYKAADKLLYQSKENGRNQLQLMQEL